MIRIGRGEWGAEFYVAAAVAKRVPTLGSLALAEQIPALGDA